MVLEYLEGTDLAAVLHERGPLPIGEAVAYVVQACEAVEEAHARGIIHRDLKPANLFLAKRPRGAPIVKVLDFGISSMAVGEDDVRLTRTGAVMGSPRYMAPEQMLDASRADRRSDVWALGVILYELLTAAAPFPGRTFGQIHERILTSDAKPPSTLRPDIAAALDAIILRCLRKPASERYQSVAELEQSLLPFKAVAPASAPSFSEIEAQSASAANIMALQPMIAAPVSRPAAPMGETVIGHPIQDKTEPSIGRTTVSWDTKTTLLRPGASVPRGRLMVLGGVAVSALVGLVLFTLSRSRNPIDTEGVAPGQRPSQAAEVVAAAPPGPSAPVVQPTVVPSASTTVASSAAPKRLLPAVAAPVKASPRPAPASPPAPVATGPAKKSTLPTISADR
jgi:serine/threonine-protein kinase